MNCVHFRAFHDHFGDNFCRIRDALSPNRRQSWWGSAAGQERGLTTEYHRLREHTLRQLTALPMIF